MKKISFLILISIIFTFCNKTQNETANTTKTKDTASYQASFTKLPDSVNYQVNSKTALKISSPIIYDVIVKNPDPTDAWFEEMLRNTDASKLVKILFRKVYEGQLIPYDRLTDTIIPIEKIRQLEKSINFNDVGKLQFEEDWYFDTLNNKFYKVVKSIIFGTELKNEDGVIRGYKAGFKIYFDPEKNKR